jgi:hypothetical protein
MAVEFLTRLRTALTPRRLGNIDLGFRPDPRQRKLPTPLISRPHLGDRGGPSDNDHYEQLCKIMTIFCIKETLDWVDGRRTRVPPRLLSKYTIRLSVLMF